MASPNFAHLHCHSEYSLLDGLANIEKLLDGAVKHGMESLALTDHGVMFGAIEFYQAAKKRNIKPIVGVEAYVAPRRMDLREGKQDASGYHQLLLAQNETGYRNLLKLTTAAQLKGYYYKPRIDKEILAAHSEGVVATSACLSAEIPRHLMAGDLAAAEKAARWYAEVFEGRFYLELQDHNLPDQHKVNTLLLDLAARLDLPMVVTNDVHYIEREHSWAQEVLLCVQTGVTINDPKRMKMDSKEFYLKSAKEMHALFSGHEKALANTIAIAESCSLDLEFGRVQLPEMPVPEGYDQDTYLSTVCHARLAERYGVVTEELERRLNYELAVIKGTGFSAYFLLLDDIISFARREGIMVGPGRGSAVGSLASYCLGITNVDPMRYDLLFERFLNPDRKSMPDIDTDFADDRRDEVIRYITTRFGAECVAQISTFGTMAAKAAVKDVGRALGVPYSDVERVAKLIPPKTNLTGAMAIPDIEALYKNDEATRQLLDTARQLEDVKRHSSTHAAGVVISRHPLVEVTPLARVGKEGEEGQATQYDAGVLEKVGLLKMDILGLTTLTLIQRTVRNVELSRGIVIDPDEIPLDDPTIYEMLSTGESAGIFQLESPPMRKVLRDLKPDRFTDIVAVVALYRPGPMNYIDQYVGRKNGAETITYLHPDLEPILSNTYGVIVYQDQVLRIALEIAGFRWGEADVLRKAMGKKLAEEMKKQQAAFEAGFSATTKWEYLQGDDGVVSAHQVPKPAYPVELARAIWPLIETFAGYGFNKSHAAAYAQLSCQTAYLKAKFPVEYVAALLSIETGSPDRMGVILAEARRLGISIRPPSVNHSDLDFVVEDGAVRYALQAVKNVGAGAIRSIVAARRKEGPFRDLDDFCRRVDWRFLNKRALESLMKAGALDMFGDPALDDLAHRAILLGNVDRICAHAQKVERAGEIGQVSLFAAMGDTEAMAIPPLLLTTVQDIPQKKLLAWEKEMLGLYISEHPLAQYLEQGRHLGAVPISALGPANAGKKVLVGAQVVSMRQLLTKKNETMVVLEVEDLERTLEAVVFPRTYARIRDLCEEEAILLLNGTVDIRNDRVQLIVDDASVFENKVNSGAEHWTVRLPRSGDIERDLALLQDVYLAMQPFRGPDCINLVARIDGSDEPITLPSTKDMYTCCPDLLEKLARLLGPDAIEVHHAAPIEQAPPAPVADDPFDSYSSIDSFRLDPEVDVDAIFADASFADRA